MKTLIGKLLQIKNEALCERLAALSTVESYKKDEQILKIGTRQTHIRFLIKGLVRFFYLDEEQTEHTQCFVDEPGYPVMVDAYAAPIYSGCHAVVDTTVLAMPLEASFKMMEESKELTVFYCRMLRRAILFHAEIAMVIRACDAQRRYMWFASTYPQVEECAKSRHIASFLCISPETLSRVRAKTLTMDKYHGQMRLKNDESPFAAIREGIWKDFPGGGNSWKNNS